MLAESLMESLSVVEYTKDSGSQSNAYRGAEGLRLSRVRMSE
jgi:hypothetical protein